VKYHEELMEMAKQSGFKPVCFPGAIHARDDFGNFVDGDLLMFAQLVQAATAEECAKVCDVKAKACVTYLCKIVLEGAADDIRTAYLSTTETERKEQ